MAVRLGLIGTSWIAGAFVDAARDVSDVDVVSVCSRSQDSVPSRGHSCRSYVSTLASSGLDDGSNEQKSLQNPCRRQLRQEEAFWYSPPKSRGSAVPAASAARDGGV